MPIGAVAKNRWASEATLTIQDARDVLCQSVLEADSLCEVHAAAGTIVMLIRAACTTLWTQT